METISTGMLIAGVISLMLTIFFFVMLARIASDTRSMADSVVKLGALLEREIERRKP